MVKYRELYPQNWGLVLAGAATLAGFRGIASLYSSQSVCVWL